MKTLIALLAASAAFVAGADGLSVPPITAQAYTLEGNNTGTAGRPQSLGCFQIGSAAVIGVYTCGGQPNSVFFSSLNSGTATGRLFGLQDLYPQGSANFAFANDLNNFVEFFMGGSLNANFPNTAGFLATAPILMFYNNGTTLPAFEMNAGLVFGSFGALPTDLGAGTLDVKTGYGVNGTAGVACSGTPTSSFASVGGVVTHC